MSTAAGQEVEPSKKKARRGSRHVEAVSHYGPVACTSAAAALVQAYLATDTSAAAGGAAQQQSHGSGSIGAKGGSCFLNMSESTLDRVKRRFGGRSKPVTLAAGLANCRAASGSSSGSSSKGARLSFGQGTKIVATKEAMHTALHCRCVFVVLRELCGNNSSTCSNGGTADSSSDAAAAVQNKGKRIDTAHLITLSPDDLFCALSVDSFPLTAVSAEVGATGAGGSRGGSSSRRGRQQQQVPVAVGTVPRAFEVVDGPAVIHRPAARQGEPWRGLEVFRSDGAAGSWRGQRIPVPLGGRRRGDGGGIAGGVFGDGDGGNRGGAALRLDLAAASADDDVADAIPPLSQESAAAAAARSRKRAAGCNGIVVCPPGASRFAAGRDATTGVGHWWSGKLGGTSSRYDETEAAVVAMPACALAAAGGEAEDAPPPPSLPLQWTSLFVDGEGRASLSPWRGLPFESKNSLTCLCRAPDRDSGMVSLAAGGEGLVLRSTPPTVYVGMAGGGGRRGAGTAIEAEGGEGAGGGGVLLELQGGTLCGSRFLPAPPSAVVSAAVDDAQGVLAVLLADQAGTALLLARDGSDFPVVEQHRGVTAAFTGDFLGTGREQVALLCSAPTGGGGAGAGAGKAGKRGGAGGAKASPGGWEQTPLKALVKRALVTDGSSVWENQNQRREGGGLHVAPSGCRVNGGGGGADTDAQSPGAGKGKGKSKGKKRQRSGEVDGGGSVKGDGESANGSAAGGSRASKTQTKDGGGGDDGHRVDRLSSVVGVLRRRVQAEEARLLRLRQARRGKAAALEAAKLALAAHVGTSGVGFDAEREATAGSVGGNRRGGATAVPVRLNARAFTDGLVAPGGDVSTPSSLDGAEERASEGSRPPPPPPPLQCTIARVRFHAPSRALCLDAHIGIPSPHTAGGAPGPSAARPSAPVFDVCLTVASAAGSLTARSAVCPRLCPGESATVRACVDVPIGLLAHGGGGGGAASLFASCTWSPCEASFPAGRARARGDHHALRMPCCSLMFSRILVSPQDMLGMGGALTSTALAPFQTTERGQEPSHCSTAAGGGGRKNGAAPESSNGGSGGSGGSGGKHLGFFDIGTPLDLLLQSDPAATTTATASLAALPQAVRSLSEIAALPEPWAGGAAVRVNGCSERAAECTLRAGDAASAPAVILAVAAGALPDGARASADHASEQGLALVAAAAAALRDEMAALEAVARERSLVGAERGERDGVGGGQAVGGLEAALERYGAAQMKSDVLAARLAGRVVAAQSSRGMRGGLL